MKKIILYSFALFWWCLMFPSSSYSVCTNDLYSSEVICSFALNNKEIHFKLIDYFMKND